MSPRESAYAALGLTPGASRAQVDQAYRRLMKAHHPDRTGGDGGRAAEINQAYAMLRQSGLAVSPRARPVPMAVKPRPRRRSRGGWVIACLLALGAIALVSMGSSQRSPVFVPRLEAGIPLSQPTPGEVLPSPVTSFDQPLHTAVIDSAIAEAVQLHSSADSSAAAEYSRDCHSSLRRQPDLAKFDACAAFDEAAATLAGADAAAASDSFSEFEVTSREVSAARVLSGDVLEAESRIHQIRSRVDMRLLPTLDSAARQTL